MTDAALSESTPYRRGIGRVPRPVVLGLWSVALAWTAWWTWELWATPALFATGPGFLFAFWLLPTLPLFLATPFRLCGRRRAGGFVLLVAVIVAVVLFFTVRFDLPREYFGASGSFTTVPHSLYAILAALTLLPVGAVVVSLALVGGMRTRETAPERRDP